MDCNQSIFEQIKRTVMVCNIEQFLAERNPLRRKLSSLCSVFALHWADFLEATASRVSNVVPTEQSSLQRRNQKII